MWHSKTLASSRRFAALGVVLGALAFSSGCQNAERPGTERAAGLMDLALEVRQGLDRAAKQYPQPLNGATWTEVNAMRGTEHAVYQIRGTNARGNRIEAEVTSAGRVIEVEHSIPESEVPAVVLESLKANRPFRFDRVGHLQRGAAIRSPLTEGNDNGKKVEVYIRRWKALELNQRKRSDSPAFADLPNLRR